MAACPFEGAEILQLLSGRDIAKDIKNNPLHLMAYQMANYAYIIVVNGEATVIDGGGWDVKGVILLCQKNKWTLKQCLFTHRHFDHTGGFLPKIMTGGREVYGPGVKEYVDMGVPVFVGSDDVSAVARQCRIDPGTILHLTDNLCFNLGNLRILCLHTPGHTPGSFCFQLSSESKSLLFTGDTLFIGSCGRVDLPESDARQMLQSLYRLSQLEESVVVLPGHNYAAPSSSSIKEEKEINGMMLQAMQVQSKQERGIGLGKNNTSGFGGLRLPDYLGVAKRLFEKFNTNKAISHHVQVERLESRF